MKILRAEPWAVAVDASGFPAEEMPEVAFLGRSNVGKSTLLNRLVGQRRLARTSATPGKTRLVHFYRIVRRNGEIGFVDLPGYGYARVSHAERARWKPMVEGYLAQRQTLRAAVLLQDVRRDPGEDETLLLDWLRERDIPSIVAATKVDKLRRGQQAARLRQLSAWLAPPASAVVGTSAKTGLGIEALWRTLDAWLCPEA